jgi:hypothetical protein
MADRPVRVAIWHGEDIYMTKSTDNDILAENVPAAARLLMDGLYLRLDDQVSVAKLRAHRRRLRDKHREQAVGQVETQVVDNGGREIAQ